MNAVVPFVFKDNLVRVANHDGEAWFVAIDVCRALDLKGDAGQHVRTLDADEFLTLSISDLDADNNQGQEGRGGLRSFLALSEPGVFRLVFRSRKPKAEEFKRWLAHEVLPALRRQGFYAMPEGKAQPPQRGELVADAPLDARVNAVRLASRLFGRDRACALWAAFGLPPPPAAAPGSEGALKAEARACLLHLLDHRPDGGNQTLRMMIEHALDGSEDDLLRLKLSFGIRVVDDREDDAFIVASRHQGLAEVFAGTDFDGGLHVRVLRRLAGAIGTGPMKFGQRTHRGVMLPASYLDHYAPAD